MFTFSIPFLTEGHVVLLLDAQVLILITGAHKAFALYKAIEEGVNHMWTVSAFQQHRHTMFMCDEDATLELRVKTVKYFKVRWFCCYLYM
jgi:glucosamine-6-phosphate deaminase